MKKDFCLVILTLNEADNIHYCLDSISSSCNDVYIVDSGSTDNTKEIASAYDVNWYENIQNGAYSAARQRNFALDIVKEDFEWVFFLDADEIVDKFFFDRLKIELKKIESDVDVISIPMLYYIHEKPVKSMGFPNYHDRIMKTTCEFVSSVGEYVKSDNRLYLDDLLLHHHFNSLGMKRFIEKQSRYADYIGKQLFMYSNGENVEYLNKPGIKGRIKRLVARFGFSRVVMRFINQYFFRLGILEGRSGFIIASYMAIFEYLVVIAKLEAKLKYENKRL